MLYQRGRPAMTRSLRHIGCLLRHHHIYVRPARIPNRILIYTGSVFYYNISAFYYISFRLTIFDGYIDDGMAYTLSLAYKGERYTSDNYDNGYGNSEEPDNKFV